MYSFACASTVVVVVQWCRSNTLVSVKHQQHTHTHIGLGNMGIVWAAPTPRMGVWGGMSGCRVGCRSQSNARRCGDATATQAKDIMTTCMMTGHHGSKCHMRGVPRGIGYKFCTRGIGQRHGQHMAAHAGCVDTDGFNNSSNGVHSDGHHDNIDVHNTVHTGETRYDPPDVRNVCMVVSYDGTRYAGFQLQVCIGMYVYMIHCMRIHKKSIHTALIQ